MKLVGARLDGKVLHAEALILSRVGSGLYLELIDRFDRNRRPDITRIAGDRSGLEGKALDVHFAGARVTVDDHRLIGFVVLDFVVGDAGHEQSGVGGPALIGADSIRAAHLKRERLINLVFNHGAECCFTRFQRWRRVCHGDSLRGRSWLQRHVERKHLQAVQMDVLAHEFFKTGSDYRDGIVAGIERSESVQAAPGGGTNHLGPRSHIPGGHFGANDQGSCGVDDRSFDGPGSSQLSA